MDTQQSFITNLFCSHIHLIALLSYFIHFNNFVSLKGATATPNDIKFDSVPVEGDDSWLFH